jgi:hypothetical protein
MKKLTAFCLSLFALMVIIRCNSSDDSSSPSSNGFSQHFGSAVSRDFIGQVVDQNGHAVQSATVKIGSSTSQTDVNGVFIINGANVHKRFAYITATKPGFIDGSRAMVPTAGKNNVKIMLIANTPVQSIQSGAASEVALPNGTKVNFDGAFQDENGNAYSGDVQVAMFHLESSNANISSLMPGMLYADDKDRKEKVLETYGMLNVELKGASGQKLQIANGHTAQITMAIDPTQLASAPATIPLWHFDETKGYWKEDGSAQKIGNNYVGNVSHFSWWNCDTPFPTVSLSVNVTDSNGNPLSYIGVGLIRNGNAPKISQTDNNGQVSGLVPMNETMVLQIFDLCGNVIYVSTIGPFSFDGRIDTVLDNVTFTTVTGSLVKCNRTGVTNGYVMLNNGNQTLISNVAEGAFNFQTVICSSNNAFTLTGYDIDDMQTTGNLNYTFSPGNTFVGDIPVCNSITEFISYKFEDDSVYWLFNNIATSSTQPGMPLHIFVQENAVGAITISGNSIDIGTYSPSNPQGIDITVVRNSPYGSDFWFGMHYWNEAGNNCTLNLKITKYGAVGDYIDLTFTGSAFNPATNIETPLSGIAHVIRDN